MTAWSSRDVVIAGHQQITRVWWSSAADRFELVASQLVVNEASAGDSDAARKRLTELEKIFRDTKARQEASGREYVRYPSRPAVATSAE